MSLSERRREFETFSKADELVGRRTKFHKLFGVSNSAKVIGRGLQLGVVNLDNVTADANGFAFACTMAFPPADEVYFTAYVRSGATRMLERLGEMKRLAGAGPDPPPAATPPADEASDEGGEIRYAARNNNVVVVLAEDGQLRLRNQGFWDELPEDVASLGVGIPVDKVDVSLYPPAASARRSLLAREFVGFLGSLIGREKVHEVAVWSDAAAVGPGMRRMPSTIPLEEIEQAIADLGGYYPGGEVARYHAAANFLDRKHFVILSGLSGSGKTRLALSYARAVHGISAAAPDPFLFVCPVRPEWTDPSGLTGYYDVLSNRYMVPPFLEAVLVATAHSSSPVFVVLDEMNLARVEYYFSDILSCIETGEPLELHAHGVPLEGSTGTSIPAALPWPHNVYITGTINVDETTNAVSSKVLDRASLIDMSAVDIDGFMTSLASRDPALAPTVASCRDRILGVHGLMSDHSVGFGYRAAEEALRYIAFAVERMGGDTGAATDEIMVQKLLVKLHGAERQRPMLAGLTKMLSGLPKSQAMLDRMMNDLNEFGTFQSAR